MHRSGIPFLGVDIEEWAALLTVLTIIFSIVLWFLKDTVKDLMNDLTYQMKSLNETIQDLKTSSANTKQSVLKHDVALERLDTTIDDHEDRIKSNEDDIDKLKERIGGKSND